jgi:N-carbamoylputrescine amidase
MILPKQLEKNASVVRDAAKIGSRSDSLPELYSSHYFCQSEDVDNFALAEPLYSTSFIAFSAWQKN